MTLSELSLHDHATGEHLPLRVPTFQPSGNPIDIYRVTSGFYSTGDSSVWTLSAQQLQYFFEIHEPSQHLVWMHTLHGPPKDSLIERVRARREAIKSRKGILSESYPLIREDREKR